MIRIERDAGWWLPILAHPAVRPGLLGARPETVANFVHDPLVLPMAAVHGGLLLSRRDALGLVYELHAAFTPEGWGREANAAGKAAMSAIFSEHGAQIVTAYELLDLPQCRVPRSFGFTTAGDFTETALGEARLSILTAAAWRSSAAYKRMTN